NADRTKMELMNFLEDGSTLLSLNAFVPNASADIGSDYSKRYPTVQGDTLGILLASGTLQPIQESGTGVDVVKTNSGYVAVFGKGDSMSGSGNTLFTTLYNRRDDLLNIKTLASLDSSLVGYWDMETMSGTKLRDWSRYGNDGTLNGTTSVQGKYGYSRSFDGVSDFLNLGIISIWNPDVGQSSISLDFMTPDSLSGGDRAVFSDTCGPELGIWIGADGRAFGIATNRVNSMSVIKPNTWYQGTLVFDMKNLSVRFYLDGVLQGITPMIIGNGLRDIPYNLGRDPGNGGAGCTAGSYFKGSIDEVRIYNRALSESEVQTLYSTTR
ncbi:MAG: LamG domain-containing protein, partial [Candidatus Gracilibacteria bacterium]|nr:LamG domain-containing protein [Candidatus Gracilibacteria bacterium]